MTEAAITIEDGVSNDPNQLLKIAHISGQLDESNIDEKIKTIYGLVEKTPKNLNLVLDLENLEYMNSKSIGYLTDLYGKITETGGQVAIAKAKANILDILQVVGLTQLIRSFDSVEEAKAHLLSTTAATDLALGESTATPESPSTEPAATQTAPATELPETSIASEAPITIETPEPQVPPTMEEAPATEVTTEAVPPQAPATTTFSLGDQTPPSTPQ